MDKEIVILTVCGVGMGSSQFLKMQMDDILKKNQITNVRTMCGDIITCYGTNCDVIFTQPQLAEQIVEKAKVPVISIKNYTNKKDVEDALLGYLNSLNK